MQRVQQKHLEIYISCSVHVLYKLSNEHLHTRGIFVLNQFSRSITLSSKHLYFSIRD